MLNERKHQAWNFWSAFVFLAAVVLVGYFLKRKGIDIRNLTLKEATVIILASYRMTRILVFEKILKTLQGCTEKKGKPLRHRHHSLHGDLSMVCRRMDHPDYDIILFSGALWRSAGICTCLSRIGLHDDTCLQPAPYVYRTQTTNTPEGEVP